MKPLKPSDEILLISTARKVCHEEISHSIQILTSWGLKVTLGKNIYGEDNQFAGSDAQRIEDLQWALDHPDAKAILCTRGGYGTSRLIDYINFQSFAKCPKWLIGFSDITILHQHINSLGYPSIHGTMPILFSNPEATSTLKEALFKPNYQLKTKSHPFNKKGTASGEIVGGNLTLILHGLATQSEIDTNEKILFIEEVDEYLYHVDRMMLQLKRAKKLSNLKALIVGSFSKMNDNNIPYGKNIYEIILEHTQEFHYPICFDFPSGHLEDNHSLIFGKVCSLSIEDNVELKY